MGESYVGNTATVLCEHHEQVALVTLNKPERRNALDFDMLAELKRIFTELQSNSEVRVIVLTGAGQAFCAGADLSATDGFSSGSQAIEDHYEPAFMRTFRLRAAILTRCLRTASSNTSRSLTPVFASCSEF